METALERAVRAVATACAINSTFVRVINTDPFEVTPNNLAFLTFKNIGLISDAQISVFLQTLSELLPAPLSVPVRSMNLNPSVVISLVVNHIEALLLKFDAGGFE